MPRNTETRGGVMVEPLVSTETRQRMCNVCGALVGDIDMHAGWHKGVAAPVPVPDQWEEALGETDIPLRGWDWHLGNALRMAATALQDGHDADYYRDCLAVTAAHVRAMAPKGVAWEEAERIVTGSERVHLRAVIGCILTADDIRAPARTTSTAPFRRADAYLHGLWLAAREVG
jgi:hypothetical protein